MNLHPKQRAKLMEAIVVGSDHWLEDDELNDLVDRLEQRALKAMKDFSILQEIVKGKVAVRWSEEQQDWRLWDIEQARDQRQAEMRGWQ